MTALALGARRIVTSAGGTYRPVPNGNYAAILPVHDLEGDLVDLVAWFPDSPRRWWLRHRDDCFILGARALEVAAYFNDPIELQGTPQMWARSGGQGACVLRWDVDLSPWFEGVKRVDCHPVVAEHLRQNFRAWEPATAGERHAA